MALPEPASRSDLISVAEVEIVRVSEWIVRCRIGTSPIDIPRERIVSSDVLRAGKRVTLSISSWFADSIGLKIHPGLTRHKCRES
jgi:hypothetical protein